jgi:tetratricopeptide (TPR) repeat protein
MARVEKTIFISYRRTHFWTALAIYQHLTQHGFDVFIDYQGIAAGDFETSILENIRGRAHFLIVLTPSALERLAEPGDWLRREIETAIESRRNIVPLMCEGFDFGSAVVLKQLTGVLEVLPRYQGLTVPAEYFDAAMQKLQTKHLSVALDAVPHPLSIDARRAADNQRAAAATAPVVQEAALTAEQWFERGYLATTVPETLRAYGEAIRLKPDFMEAYLNRGVARGAGGDLPGAIADYSEAIRLKPDDAKAYSNRGVARRSGGDLPGAIADFDEAIRLKPDSAKAYNNRGLARRSGGDLPGAIADFDEAIRLKPDSAEAYNNRGVVREKVRDLPGAIADFDEAIRLTPDYANAYNNRGMARRSGGDWRGAIADFDEAIRLKPDSAEAYFNRAIIRKEQKQNASAIADYRMYLELGGGVRDGDQAEAEDIIRQLQRLAAT